MAILDTDAQLVVTKTTSTSLSSSTRISAALPVAMSTQDESYMPVQSFTGELVIYALWNEYEATYSATYGTAESATFQREQNLVVETNIYTQRTATVAEPEQTLAVAVNRTGTLTKRATTVAPRSTTVTREAVLDVIDRRISVDVPLAVTATAEIEVQPGISGALSATTLVYSGTDQPTSGIRTENVTINSVIVRRPATAAVRSSIVSREAVLDTAQNISGKLSVSFSTYDETGVRPNLSVEMPVAVSTSTEWGTGAIATDAELSITMSTRTGTSYDISGELSVTVNPVPGALRTQWSTAGALSVTTTITPGDGVAVTQTGTAAPTSIAFDLSATADVTLLPLGRTWVEFDLSASAYVYKPYVPSGDGPQTVQVDVWDARHTGVLAVLDKRWALSWQDDFNDSGSGSITLHSNDPKATIENLNTLNIVKFKYAGAMVHGFRIEKRTLDVVKDGDVEAQVIKLDGRGLLSLIADAIVYPEYGLNRVTGTQRNFSFASAQGAWYVASEWAATLGARWDAATSWLWGMASAPENWQDPAAQWIWPTGPLAAAAPERVWYRSTFTVSTPLVVTIYATADNQFIMYMDGERIISSNEDNQYAWKQKYSHSMYLDVGTHLVAAEVWNVDEGEQSITQTTTQTVTVENVEMVEGTTTTPVDYDTNSVRPKYAKDSNKPYIGAGFTDGSLGAYVSSTGCVDGHCGTDAFDSSTSSYWLSVGNYQSWTSAYEYVEGTFSDRKVTAVKVSVKGGPYDMYISLKLGSGAWQGSNTVPYKAQEVDTNANIKYVTKVRISKDDTKTVTIPGGGNTADRVRITFGDLWDSGIGQYQYRAGVKDVHVSSVTQVGGETTTTVNQVTTTTEEEVTVTQTYTFPNTAGLIATVAQVDGEGNVVNVIHRTDTTWLCHRGTRPGWMPSQILYQLMSEAQARDVLGADLVSLGFSAYYDSHGAPWSMPKQDLAFQIGTDYLSVVRSLTEASDLDVWLDPISLTLHAAPRKGADLATGPAPLILRQGFSLTEMSADVTRPTATRMVIETNYGWTETASQAQEMALGRIESLVSLGGVLSLDEGINTTNKLLEVSAYENTDVTLSHTDAIGPKAYEDYNTGDTILAPADFGPGLNRYQVLSITAREDDAGNVTFTPELSKE